MEKRKKASKTLDAKKKKLLQQVQTSYVTPGEPDAFAGADKLVRAARAEGLKPSSVRSWLKTQPAYTLHKPIRKNFKRNRVIVNGKDEQWQADLVDVQSLKESNDDYKYILTVIDVLSKYAWAVPLKDKRGQTLVEAFGTIFGEGRQPERLQTDAGTEFINKKFQDFLKSKGIEHFVTYNDPKAQIVERFNRTLKGRMWRYFDHANSIRYLDVLADLVKSYNNSFHRSIRMPPVLVTDFNAQDVWRTLYGKDIGKWRNVRFRFKVGDQVRLMKIKKTFEKGYMPNWTEEVFTITQRLRRIPPVYRVKEYDGTELKGTFYEDQLQKVEQKDDDLFRIENVVKSRGRGRQKEYLVHWKGWPNKYDQWIPASQIQLL